MQARFAVLAVMALALAVAPVETRAAPPAATYKIDRDHSTALFRVKHMETSWTYGRFNEIAGTLVVDDDSAKSSIDVEIKVESIDTNAAARDKHLKSQDFFSAAEFPTITFKSKEVKKDGEALSVTGDFTIHGVTKSVTTKVMHVGSGKGMKGESRIGYETTFAIKRSEFGMKYGLPNMVGDEITITISLEAIGQ